MDPNCNVHPMKSPRVNPESEEALEILIREQPTKEERTAGHSARGSLVFSKRESPRDTKMGFRLLMVAEKRVEYKRHKNVHEGEPRARNKETGRCPLPTFWVTH
jgi:hypothetical protein